MKMEKIMIEKECRLLLVDDDRIILATFSKQLKNAGFDVIVANSGEQGLELASRDNAIDLAIIDVGMPGISGLEMAQQLKPLGIAWIFLSAYDDQATVESAVNEGAMGYLVKPIDVSKAIPTILSGIKRARDIDNYIDTEARLSGALETGSQVNVAVGMLMERHNLGRQQAFDMMRNKARSERRKVKDVALEVLHAWHIFNFIEDK